MAATSLTFTLPARADLEQEYSTRYVTRRPTASASDPLIQLDAKQLSGVASKLLYRAQIVRNNTARATRTGAALDQDGVSLDLPRGAPAGASGQIAVTASSTGFSVIAGEPGKVNGVRYQCAAGGTYQDGQLMPVSALDVGPQTDQMAGALFTWDSPPIGAGPGGTVAPVSMGSTRGLIGGALAEQDDPYRQRLNYKEAHPADSGNEAQYIETAGATPGISVCAAFVYPAIGGAGTKCAVGVMNRSALNISRCPTAAEEAQITLWTPANMPGDDSYVTGATATNLVTLAILATWLKAGWVDASPWPLWSASAPVKVSSSPAPTATTFTFTASGVAPVPGQTLAFYDPVGMVFRPKRILSVTTISGPLYEVTCDTSQGATDLTYTPAVGQLVCPWSASLNLLVQPLLLQFQTLGPGEQIPDADLYDPGDRQRRQPEEPLYPYSLGYRFIDPVFAIPALKDAALAAVIDGAGINTAFPYVTPVGSAGVSSFLTEPQFFAVFPE